MGLKTPGRNEFIRDPINSSHAGGWVRKGRFDTKKQGKGRKSAPVRAPVPRKQGLKRSRYAVPEHTRITFERQFQENKD